MRYKKGQVDINPAWEMAIAEDSFRTNIIRERNLGKTVTYLNQLNVLANKAGREAEAKYMRRLREDAFKEIVRASNTPVIQEWLFEKFWGSGASKVWGRLQNQVAKDPQTPLEFVPVVDGEFVLRGDLRMAAWGLKPNSSGIILERIVECLGTEEGQYLLQSQGLPSDMFSQSHTKE